MERSPSMKKIKMPHPHPENLMSLDGQYQRSGDDLLRITREYDENGSPTFWITGIHTNYFKDQM